MQKKLKDCRILVVDDTPENIDILGALLKEYKRSFALDGQSALEKAKSDTPPDLILLDIMMPGMDGYEVCAKLKMDESTRSIPVIFVTALGEVADEAKGFAIGALDYITKPFKPAVVKERVKTHLSLKLATQELENQNALLEAKVRERTQLLEQALKKLQDVSLETIVRLSRAAEYKDDDTATHILRMSHYSAAVARAMGLSEKEVTNILHAAPMHDIGKIGIPDRILLKPGKLDDEEWKIMRKHSYMGTKILCGSESEVIKLGEIVAYTHHEKWDGNGYPRRLKGEDIPLAGRIVAIADVFDALTSKRPYKEPFSLEKSFRIVRESDGTHFDPEVVKAFFSVESEILEIKERYQDTACSHLFSMVG